MLNIGRGRLREHPKGTSDHTCAHSFHPLRVSFHYVTSGQKALLGRILCNFRLPMRTHKGTPKKAQNILPVMTSLPVRAASGDVTSGSSTASLHLKCYLSCAHILLSWLKSNKGEKIEKCAWKGFSCIDRLLKLTFGNDHLAVWGINYRTLQFKRKDFGKSWSKLLIFNGQKK
jgi:hypothetical protein